MDVWEICNLTVESASKIQEQAACQNKLRLQSSPTLTREGEAWGLFNVLLGFFLSNLFKGEKKKYPNFSSVNYTRIWIDSLGWCVQQNRKGEGVLLWSLYIVFQLSKRKNSQCPPSLLMGKGRWHLREGRNLSGKEHLSLPQPYS